MSRVGGVLPMSWHEVWERKSQLVNDSRPTLADLIAMDGFDKGAGQFSIADWRSYTTHVLTSLGIKSGDSVCEIGCGAGAMLYAFREQGIRVTGVDYSNSLITTAHRAMPDTEFYVAEAKRVPYADNRFDAVLSHSVF